MVICTPQTRRKKMMMPDDFFKKNVEMWEKFTASYMDTLFKTVEKAMEQSQSIKERVDKAAAQAVASQLDAALTSLQALQRQVEALSAKVDKLVEEE
jgi:DNA-binding transcriptional regulator GbsR (MarR family)